MKKITLLFFYFMFFFLAATQAQVTSKKLSPYTRSFLARINQPDVSPTQIKTLQKKAGVKQSGLQEYVSTFIYLDENAETQALEQSGVKTNTRIGNIITAQIPVDMLETVAALPEVKYVQMGTPICKKMDKARVASKVDKVQTGISPLTGPFLGKNVVVGIIDNGFEYGHPNFYNKDHTEYRIKRVWDQNALTGISPTGFSYGKELSTQADILAAANDMTGVSHGTHVAGIAAGADTSNGNTYYGIAGDADIVLVSCTKSNSDVVDGIKYIYDYATSVGKPCVINISLGSFGGPHDGTSSFDVLTDQLQGKGKLLVGAAGNEGSSNMHVSKTFNQTDTIFRTFCGSDNIDCDIWGEVGKKYKVQVCVYDTINKKTIYTSPEYSASEDLFDKDIKLLTATSGARGHVYLNSGLDPQTNKPNIYMSSAITSVSDGNCIGIIIKATEGTVNGWTDAQYSNFNSYNQTGWSDGDKNCSIDEVGGTGKQIISVGAYVSNTTYTNLDNTQYTTPDESLYKLATFSSTGPTTDGRMKPEITAPGTIIASSVSSYDATDPASRVKATTVDGKTYYYGMMAGTSMSTPYVTGVLATWLQANPELTPDEVKSILQKTAINDFYTGAILPNGNNTWGYGKIDAYSGILEVIKQSTAINEIPALPQSILMYSTTDNQRLLKFLFTQGDTNVQIDVFNVNGQKLQNKKIAEVTSKQEETIDLVNLPKGLYLIKITGDKLNQVFKASTK
jgi:subtilisin family serine protease